MSRLDVFDMLFRAKWNIPRATVELGLLSTETNWEDVKSQFKDYCVSRSTLEIE
jgi:hypothetical protein